MTDQPTTPAPSAPATPPTADHVWRLQETGGLWCGNDGCALSWPDWLYGGKPNCPATAPADDARADAYYRQMTAPPPPGALEAIRERLHSDNPQRRTVRMDAAPDAGLREQYAAAIREAITSAPTDDADDLVPAVLAVRDRAMEQLRDRLDSARASRKRWMNGYQAAAEQQAGWIRRAEQAEAAVARVRALHRPVGTIAGPRCAGCMLDDPFEAHPADQCPTIAALDQQQEADR